MPAEIARYRYKEGDIWLGLIPVPHETARPVIDKLKAFRDRLAADQSLQADWRARQIAVQGGCDFVEVHVKAPLEVCEKRDPKNLYKKARAGEITQDDWIDLESAMTRSAVPGGPTRTRFVVKPSRRVSSPVVLPTSQRW